MKSGNQKSEIRIVIAALLAIWALAIGPSAARASELGRHGITLTWTASSTPGIAVYRIYRGTASGGPYAPVAMRLNLNGASTITWTDADEKLQSGHTYYYVVTAATLFNVESSYSNEASATWP